MGELLKISDRLGGGSIFAFRAQSGSLEAWRFGGLEEPQRLRPGLSPAATMKPDAARLSRSPRRTTKEHKDCQRGGTADSDEHREHREDRGAQRRAACYRRQDCQCILEITKDTKDTVQARSDKPSTAKRRRRGRAVRARKAHVRPEGLRSVAGFARHALVLGKFCGVSRRPSCPIGPIGPTAELSGRRQKRKGWG